MIPLSEPLLHGNEWDYVKECLDTNWVSSVGPFVTRFEREVAAKANAAHGVAVSSGTAALHLALLVAGVQPGDEIVVPALTFIAPANAVRYVGAAPVFVDVEDEQGQIDCAKTAAFLARTYDIDAGVATNRLTGRRLRAILFVDLLGHPIDVDPLRALSSQYGLTLIEDATESLGALYRGRPVGTLGDIGCFSFNGNKTVTAGGGGVLVTNVDTQAARARYLSTQAKDDGAEYIHQAVGYNYRLTNIQAALGVAQLGHLDQHVEAKRQIASRYREAFSSVPGVRLMDEAPWAFSTFWLCTVRIDAEIYGESSRALLRRLQHANIQARPLWQPLHQSPVYAGALADGCPVAENLYANALSLPSSPGLRLVDQQRVIDLVATPDR